MITAELLEAVISAEKIAVGSKSRKLKDVGAHRDGRVFLRSPDEQFEYTFILRQAIYLADNFTVGLLWTNAGKHSDVTKDIILVRFQGPHDGRSPIGTDAHHDYHIHEISVDDIADERYSKPSQRHTTNQYNSFEAAASLFIQKYHIIGIDSFFTPFWEARKEIDGQLSIDDMIK